MSNKQKTFEKLYIVSSDSGVLIEKGESHEEEYNEESFQMFDYYNLDQSEDYWDKSNITNDQKKIEKRLRKEESECEYEAFLKGQAEDMISQMTFSRAREIHEIFSEDDNSIFMDIPYEIKRYETLFSMLKESGEFGHYITRYIILDCIEDKYPELNERKR